MPGDQFAGQSCDDVGQVEAAFVGGDLAVEQDLQQNVSQLFADLGVVA